MKNNDALKEQAKAAFLEELKKAGLTEAFAKDHLFDEWFERGFLVCHHLWVTEESADK